MEYFIIFIHAYIPLHLLCMIFILLSFIIQKEQPDFVDWLLILFMSPGIVLFFIALLIFKGELK